MKKSQSGERLKCSSLHRLERCSIFKARPAQLTMAYLMVPIHPKPTSSMCRLPYHHFLVLVYISTRHLPSAILFSDTLSSYVSTTNLFYFALPTLLFLMWPLIGKSGSSSLNHSRARRVFLAQTPILLFNCCHDSPTTVRRMFEMLCKRIVIFFPTIERSVAEVACDIIRIGLKRIVKETCFG